MRERCSVPPADPVDTKRRGRDVSLSKEKERAARGKTIFLTSNVKNVEKAANSLTFGGENMDNNKLKIGERLKLARILRGLTIEEAAEQLGFSRRALSSWEHGRNTPHPLHEKRIDEFASRWIREALGN